VPQIFLGDWHIGGCSDLQREIETGNFFQQLSAAGLPYILRAPTSADTGSSTNDPVSFTSLPSAPIGLYLNNESIESADREVKVFACSTEPQRASLTLLDQFASSDGVTVNYSRMRTSNEFQHFVKIASRLRTIPLENIAELSENERLSFFVNIYNALIIHAVCAFGSPADFTEARSQFYSGGSGAMYDIGGHLFSPDDIEHGILRANKRHPYQKNEQINFLKDGDARALITLKTLDPRIHFVLNCGAKSCPPIKILPENPAAALSLGASAYLQSELSISPELKCIRLPKLAFWYESDFGASKIDALRKLLEYLPEGIRQQQIVAFEAIAGEKLEDCTSLPADCVVVYNDYDWGSNSGSL
jgi:hypothetical protein